MIPMEIPGSLNLSAFTGALIASMVLYFFTMGVSVALYILNALGLYTIAQRRGIRHSWMSWLPIASLWILGSISDQYRYVVGGRICNKRRVLLALAILAAAGILALIVTAVLLLAGLIEGLPRLDPANPLTILEGLGAPALVAVALLAVIYLAVIISAVIQYVCYYHLFASCQPKYKVLFLVLSLALNFLLPILVFACRNQDLGMPPRKDAPAPLPDPLEETE